MMDFLIQFKRTYCLMIRFEMEWVTELILSI